MRRFIVVAGLFAVGLAYCVLSPFRHESYPLAATLLSIAAIALGVCLGMPATLADRVTAGLDALRQPSPAAATRIAIAVGVVSGCYLLATVFRQEVDLVPRLSDEFSYLIQARMLAGGTLWHAPHPADVRLAFDTLNMLVEPVYGSMYFPGTALFHVPAVWLGVPYWYVSLLLSAACCALLYRLLVDLIDGVYALVGVAMLLGLTMFRALSVMLLSQTPMLLMALVMMLAYIRWRRRFDWRWAALIGALAGWSGITRPADALCYAVAIGLAMLMDLHGGAASGASASPANAAGTAAPQSAAAPSRRPWLLTLACLVLPALPFLSLQLIQNIGMTGHWWEFPEARYADRTYPAPMVGFHHYDPATWTRPPTRRIALVSETIEQAFYAYHKPMEVPRTWWDLRFPETFRYGLPHPLMVALLPVGLAALWLGGRGAEADRRRPRLVLTVVLLFFLGFYAFYVFFIPHYMIVIAPPLIMLVLLGASAVERALAAWRRFAPAAALGLPLSVAALAIGALPEFRPADRDHAMMPGTEPIYVGYLLQELESTLGNERALVLFQFDLTTYVRAGESLYTADVAWIDDAKVIRAADRGADNAALFGYYANVAKQPDRVVFIYDAKTGKLSDPLGTVGQLANR